jgi:glycosyltransferase involved in cell wall biosynthesis
MKSDELRVLYVCHDFPFPPMHGGLVDMWNRVQALNHLGVQLDLIATVKEEPGAAALNIVQRQVRSLRLIKRKSFKSGLFHWKPMQVAIRNELRAIRIDKEYDFVLMQTEFVTEILQNRTIKWYKSIIRVENDEYSYHIQTAKAQRSLARKLYFLQEALRIKIHSAKALRLADVLWFISHKELTHFRIQSGLGASGRQIFMPSAVNLGLMDRPHLGCKKVLFVGSLWNPLNKAALEWYILNVHPKLANLSDYEFVIAGSSQGKNCDWLRDLVSHFSNIEIIFDANDLSSVYRECALFVNPMQSGAGVKLKTVEAGVRGLPILSTAVGAEGTGFLPDVHFKLATSSLEFSSGVRELLENPRIAASMVERCQEFLLENYDQMRVLRRELQI